MLKTLKANLLRSVSHLALVNGMSAAEAAAFKKQADAWIAANPTRARQMAAEVERAKLKLGHHG